MSATTDAWRDLYDAQTEANGGVAYLATVTGFATDVPAIVSANKTDDILVRLGGGSAEQGDYSIQLRASDFPILPPKRTPIFANGPATGANLLIGSINVNNGILYVEAVDFAAAS